ncbi:MAG: aldehyde dehydrogenase family protein [Marinifilaceae bacterium]|jgi:acyl-CoA reductase-like NAD-dependent aldehyde dehydrogenase|nr:aldehyde dehydrogenase family protein [Marinifilaceae bacterium]
MEKLYVNSPFDNKLIEELVFESNHDIEIKIQKAYSLAKNKSRRLAAHKRIEILEKLKVLMIENKNHIINTAIYEGGKPYRDTDVEFNRAINGISIAIESISQLKGEEIPMGLAAGTENKLAFTISEPIGLVFSISAFNHPINLVIHQLVTVFAAGCPVIMKPALTTPLSTINIVKLLQQAGADKGWVQYCICTDSQAENIVKDSRIAYLSFIGSAKIGWYLRSLISPGVHCALEHGGAAPVVVQPSANVPDCAQKIAKGAFYHAGQVCVSVQRVFVNNQIADELIHNLKQIVSKLKVGDPLNKDTDIGPLILEKEQNRIYKWVTDAVNEGAQLICGGNKLGNNCFEPTILLNPSQKSLVSEMEIFGPVLCIYTYDKIEDAIQLANSTKWSFQAALFSNELNEIMDISSSIDSAAIMINDHTAFRVDWMPFGGQANSGIGIGGILYSMKEMQKKKLIVINKS